MRQEFKIDYKEKKGARGTLGVMLMAIGGIGLLEGYSLALNQAKSGLILIGLFSLIHLGAIPVGFGIKQEIKGFLWIGVLLTLFLFLSRVGQILRKVPSVSGSGWSMGILMVFLLAALLWEIRRGRVKKSA